MDMDSTIDWSKVQGLCEERQLKRLNREWSEADTIKEELVTLGVVLNDDRREWVHTESGASGSYEMKDAMVKNGPAGKASIPKSSKHVKSERDWDCPQCKNINWGHRLRCHRCNAARPLAENVLLSYSEQRAAEGQAERDEATACDRAFNKAKAEREKADAELELAVLEKQRQAEEHAALHPTPIVEAAAAKPKAKAKVEVKAPPEPKTGNAEGAATLKRIREEMMQRKQQEAKRQKTDAKPKAPVTLDNMVLSTDEGNRDTLVKNARILAKVAAAKKAQLRKHAKLLGLFSDIMELPQRDASKDVATIQDCCCRIGAELLRPVSPDEQLAQAAQWLTGTASVLVGLATKLLRTNNDNVKASAVKLARAIVLCSGSDCGTHGRKAKALLHEAGLAETLQQVKTSDPSPAVMEALRECFKTMQDLGYEVR